MSCRAGWVLLGVTGDTIPVACVSRACVIRAEQNSDVAYA